VAAGRGGDARERERNGGEMAFLASQPQLNDVDERRFLYLIIYGTGVVQQKPVRPLCVEVYLEQKKGRSRGAGDRKTFVHGRSPRRIFLRNNAVFSGAR